MNGSVMKKIGVVIILISILSTLVLTLSSCVTFDFEQITGVNIIKDAKVSSNDGSEKINNVKDGKSTKWSTKKQGAEILIEFDKAALINTVVIKEPGDVVNEFNIYYKNADDGEFVHLYKQDRIDKYRMCVVEDTQTTALKIVFDSFEKKLSVEEIEVYYLKNSKNNFRVNSYILSDLNKQTNKTAIQSRYDDPDYAGWFSTLTDTTIIGNIQVYSDGRVESLSGKDNLKKDVEILKTMNPNIKVHATIMLNIVPGDTKTMNKAIMKLINDSVTFNKAMINIGELVEYSNLDGVDYDWEYPQRPWEWDAYGELIINTKKAIKGREISVALWPYQINFSKEAMAAIDTVNLMSYDQHDKDKRYRDHSPIYGMGLDVMEYILGVGFTKQQVRLGIPFYGRTADQYPIWPDFNVKYGKWVNCDNDFTYVNSANETVANPNFFNGYAMVRDKTALAIAYDLGGIMIFRSECDIGYTNQYSLHKAVQETVSQRIS